MSLLSLDDTHNTTVPRAVNNPDRFEPRYNYDVGQGSVRSAAASTRLIDKRGKNDERTIIRQAIVWRLGRCRCDHGNDGYDETLTYSAA